MSARNAWHNDPPISDPKVTKMPGRVPPEKLGGDVRHASWNPYPISDQNLWFSLPYFRPDQKLIPYFSPEAPEPGAWPERVTSCYGTYTVGVNIKREMVLSPNDAEVASSKKHTQFKTRVNKPYPISDQNGWKKHTPWRRTYPYSLYKGLPPGAKKASQIMSLPAYASKTKQLMIWEAVFHQGR